MTPLLKQQIVGRRVRELRKQRGLSLRTLAGQTGFSPSFISQLENGHVSPSIGSMEKIAEAVGVTLSELFAEAAAGAGGTVVRASERAALSSEWSNAEIEALSPTRLDQHLVPFLITIRPGGRSGKHPYSHPREEFAFVLQGRIDLTLGPDRHSLAAGDAVLMLPGELRLLENSSGRPARVLIVSTRSGPPLAGSPIGRSQPSPRPRPRPRS